MDQIKDSILNMTKRINKLDFHLRFQKYNRIYLKTLLQILPVHIKLYIFQPL